MSDARSFLPERFETLDQAKERRRKLIGSLRRDGRPEALALARRLWACQPGERCRSGACAVCNRLWRRSFLRQAAEVVDGQPTLLRISVVAQGGRVAPGDLVTFDLARFVKSRQRALQRALTDGTLLLGGVDVSYNTMNNQDGHWQAHLYLLLFARDRRDLRDNIRARCPPEPTARRPYEFAEVRPEDYPEVVSYAVKGEFYWRSSFTDVNGRTNGRGVSLKPEQAVEAALFLDKYPLGSRLLLKGIKRFYTSWGCILAKAD